MIRSLSVLSTLLAFASCSDRPSFYGEEWPDYYQKRHEETTRKKLDNREIVHWATNPKDKRRIGFYETWQVKVQGSRATRECHYIRDAGGLHDIGFVTNEGVFYRFEKSGRLEEKPVGEYTIVTIGLKVFFGIPAHENLDLEEIDPYK